MKEGLNKVLYQVAYDFKAFENLFNRRRKHGGKREKKREKQQVRLICN